MKSPESQPNIASYENDPPAQAAKRVRNLARKYIETVEEVVSGEATEESQRDAHTELIEALDTLADTLPDNDELREKIHGELLGDDSTVRLKVMKWAASGEYNNDLNTLSDRLEKRYQKAA